MFGMKICFVLIILNIKWNEWKKIYSRSAGCIIYEYVNLRKAFKGANYGEINNAILNQPVSDLDRSFNLNEPLQL